MASRTPIEAQDFYPYGATRIDTKTNYGGKKRKYAGTDYDALSGLNYAMARYQSPTRGQFVSEDPVFWSTQQNLADPQSLNS
jgi:RHS repeat-associated protein